MTGHAEREATNKIPAEPLRPFLPAWLDDLGLTAPEFRVLLHLWRWGRTRTGVKACTSTADTIQRTCRLSENTVWKCLRSLAAKGLILRKKQFQQPNRYYVQIPSPITAKETVIESPQTERQLIPQKERRLIPQTRGRKGMRRKGTRSEGGEGSPPPSIPLLLSEADTQAAAKELKLPADSIGRLFEEFRAVKGPWVRKDYPAGLTPNQAVTAFLVFIQNDSRGKRSLVQARAKAPRHREDPFGSAPAPEPTWPWREYLAALSVDDWRREYADRLWVSLPETLQSQLKQPSAVATTAASDRLDKCSS